MTAITHDQRTLTPSLPDSALSRARDIARRGGLAQPVLATDGSDVAAASGVSQGALRADTPRLDLTDKPVAEIARDLIDCFDIEGENFCLFVGFTDMTPGDTRWREVFSTEVERAQANDPGGSLAGYVRWLATLDDAEREKLAEQSLRDGYATVGKVKLYDYVGLDIPIPYGFFDKHPELGIAEGSPQADALRTAAATGDPIDMGVFYQPPAGELAEGYEEEVAALVTSTGITRAEAVAFLRSQDMSSPLVLAPAGRDTAEVGGGGAIESVPGSPTYRYIIYSAYREQERNDFCAQLRSSQSTVPTTGGTTRSGTGTTTLVGTTRTVHLPDRCT